MNFLWTGIFAFLFCHSVHSQEQTQAPADPSLQNPNVASKPGVAKPEKRKFLPELDSEEQLSSIFKDIVVIQRRAVTRAGEFLLGTSFQLDFSDGPKTQYGLGIKGGYAIGGQGCKYSFFEIRDKVIVDIDRYESTQLRSGSDSANWKGLTQ